MSDVARQKDALSLNLGEIKVTHLQVAVAAVDILLERARGFAGNFSGEVSRFIEAARGWLFSGTVSAAERYEEPSSELSAFLSSCRTIFWALAIFSGLSNLLMLTGSFFM